LNRTIAYDIAIVWSGFNYAIRNYLYIV